MEMDWLQMLKAGIGTLVAILLVVALFIMFLQDATQKKHTVLRNFPLVAPRLANALLAAGFKEKYRRVACHAQNMNKEIDMIAHSRGARHARELERRHVRLVQPAGGLVALDVLWPLPAAIAARNA